SHLDGVVDAEIMSYDPYVVSTGRANGLHDTFRRNIPGHIDSFDLGMLSDHRRSDVERRSFFGESFGINNHHFWVVLLDGGTECVVSIIGHEEVRVVEDHPDGPRSSNRLGH